MKPFRIILLILTAILLLLSLLTEKDKQATYVIMFCLSLTILVITIVIELVEIIVKHYKSKD